MKPQLIYFEWEPEVAIIPGPNHDIHLKQLVSISIHFPQYAWRVVLLTMNAYDNPFPYFLQHVHFVHYTIYTPSWIEITVSSPWTITCWWHIRVITDGQYYSTFCHGICGSPPTTNNILTYCHGVSGLSPVANSVSICCSLVAALPFPS